MIMTSDRGVLTSIIVFSLDKKIQVIYAPYTLRVCLVDCNRRYNVIVILMV